MNETLSTVITLTVGTNAAVSLYQNMASIVRGDKNTVAQIADNVNSLDLKLERLSEGIFFVPGLEMIKDSSRPNGKVNDLREVRESLKPLHQLLSQDIIASSMIQTPEQLSKVMDKNPWDLLIDIRPVSRSELPTNPALIPVCFQDGNIVYIGWIMRGALSGSFNCEYNDLWLPHSGNSLHTKRGFYDREREISLTKHEMKSGTQKVINIDDETLTIRIPSGGMVGTRLRVPGKGDVDPVTKKRGDLHLKISEKEALFDPQIFQSFSFGKTPNNSETIIPNFENAFTGKCVQENVNIPDKSTSRNSNQVSSIRSKKVVTDATFKQDVLESKLLVLVLFGAPWCGPCRMVTPVVNELSEQYDGQIKVFSLDVDENPSVASQYGIKSVPTIMIYRNGQKIDMVVGAVAKTTLVKTLNRWI